MSLFHRQMHAPLTQGKKKNVVQLTRVLKQVRVTQGGKSQVTFGDPQCLTGVVYRYLLGEADEDSRQGWTVVRGLGKAL